MNRPWSCFLDIGYFDKRMPDYCYCQVKEEWIKANSVSETIDTPLGHEITHWMPLPTPPSVKEG